MSTQNLIVAHLQQQKSRIAGMLSPGGKMLQAGNAASEFSPVASDFGGRKFQLAAKKMRILNSERMGFPAHEMRNRLAGEIKARFADLHNLLHLSPSQPGTKSSWSDVNMVFPGNTMPGRSTSPEESGTLRQGSIIQKFNVAPKPGQSLESFKEQAQRLPAARKKTGESANTVRLAPKDRLFSHIQEITPALKEQKEITSSEGEDTVPGTSSTGTSSSPADSIQRQFEPSLSTKKVAIPEQPEQVARPLDEKKRSLSTGEYSGGKREKIQFDSAKPQAPYPLRPEAGFELPKQVSSPVDSNVIPGGEPDRDAVIKPAKSLPLAMPVLTIRVVPYIEKPKALPVARQTRPVAGPSKLPLANRVRSESLPTTGNTPTISLPITRQTNTTANIVQRKIEQTVSGMPALDEFGKDEEAHLIQPEFGGNNITQAKIDEPAAIQSASPSSSEAYARQDQPITQRIRYRQGAPSVLQSIKQPMAITPQQPILSAEKYQKFPEQITAPPAQPIFGSNTLPVLVQVQTQGMPVSGQVRPQQVVANMPSHLQGHPRRFEHALPGRTGLNFREPFIPDEPEKMELARRIPQPGSFRSSELNSSPSAAAISLPLKQEATTGHLPILSSQFPTDTPAAQPPAATAPPVAVTPGQQRPSQNVIQRIWEEHSAPQHAQGSGGGPQDGQGAPSASADIDQLAESILPFVKRLLEIEAERSGSRFR